MLGTTVIITETMAIEQIKKKLQTYLSKDNKNAIKYFYIAMIALTVIIAIILIDIMVTRDVENKKSINANAYENIAFSECQNPTIINFINGYFKARHSLNYPKIFSSYGRDYYTEMREDKNGEVKKLVDTIRYEKTFVRNYENIRVYTSDGYRENEVACIVTYDLLLGFSDDSAPMIIIFYLVKNGESYVINDNLDVGTSKFLMACMDAPEVKGIYSDVKTRLTRNLVSNEALKLAYNSLRQFEMNMNGDLNYDKVNLIENYGLKEFDPINDAEEIYDYIMKEKQAEIDKKKLDDYLEKLILAASASEIK